MGCGCLSKSQVQSPKSPNNQNLPQLNHRGSPSKQLSHVKKSVEDNSTNKNQSTQNKNQSRQLLAKLDPNPEIGQSSNSIKKQPTAIIDEQMIIVSRPNLTSKQKAQTRKQIASKNNKVLKQDYQYIITQQDLPEGKLRPLELNNDEQKNQMLSSVCQKIDIDKMCRPGDYSQNQQKRNNQQICDVQAMNKIDGNSQNCIIARSITTHLDIGQVTWDSLKGQINVPEQRQQRKQSSQNRILDSNQEKQVKQQQKKIKQSSQINEDICHSPTTKIHVSKLEWPRREESQQEIDHQSNQNFKSSIPMETKYKNDIRQNNNSKKQWIKDDSNKDGEQKFIKQGKYEGPKFSRVEGYSLNEQSRVNVLVSGANVRQEQLVKTKINRTSSVTSSENSPHEISTIAQTKVKRR